MNKNETSKEIILKAIKTELKKYETISSREAGAVSFPKDIDIELIEQDNMVRLSLSSKAIGVKQDKKEYYNMQDVAAAFEGWALVIYTHYAKQKNYKVQLALKEEARVEIQHFSQIGAYLGERGHYYRLLYRACRFAEQYSWFYLDNTLDYFVKNFDKYLKSGVHFTNNYPEDKNTESSNEQDKEDINYSENDIEDLFSDEGWQESAEGKKLCDVFGSRLYRQLPVGLFAEEKKDANAVFTGKKSAIDLWSCKDDTLTVFELKWENKMIGIITEIFFYCNYMRDMYGEGKNIAQYNFVPHKIDVCYRGYDNIAKRKFKKINGYMLYDQGNLHQAITKNVLEEMNKAVFTVGEATINYGWIEYKVDDGLKIELNTN